MGCKKLHIVDLDAAFEEYINLSQLKKLETQLKFLAQLGGA